MTHTATQMMQPAGCPGALREVPRPTVLRGVGPRKFGKPPSARPAAPPATTSRQWLWQQRLWRLRPRRRGASRQGPRWQRRQRWRRWQRQRRRQRRRRRRRRPGSMAKGPAAASPAGSHPGPAAATAGRCPGRPGPSRCSNSTTPSCCRPGRPSSSSSWSPTSPPPAPAAGPGRPTTRGSPIGPRARRRRPPPRRRRPPPRRRRPPLRRSATDSAVAGSSRLPEASPGGGAVGGLGVRGSSSGCSCPKGSAA